MKRRALCSNWWDWLLSERTDLQSAEALVKEEWESLRVAHQALQELLERCLTVRAEELSAVEPLLRGNELCGVFEHNQLKMILRERYTTAGSLP